MEHEERIKINVNLDGKVFTLKILPEDEETIRKAVNRLNDEIKSFARKYQFENDKHLFSLILLKEMAEKEALKKEIKDFENNWKKEIKAFFDILNSD